MVSNAEALDRGTAITRTANPCRNFPIAMGDGLLVTYRADSPVKALYAAIEDLEQVNPEAKTAIIRLEVIGAVEYFVGHRKPGEKAKLSQGIVD